MLLQRSFGPVSALFVLTAIGGALAFPSFVHGQEPAKRAGLKGASPKVAVLTGGADKDLKKLRDTLAKLPGVKFKADEIKFADFGREGGLFTSFFTIELTDRSKTDIGAVAKAVSAAKIAPKKGSASAFYLIVRYRPDSTNDKKLRAALAKVKGVVADTSWAGDSNLWVSVDGSGQGKLAEITRALHEARIPIRDPILDAD